jgi:hypothetical protein
MIEKENVIYNVPAACIVYGYFAVYFVLVYKSKLSKLYIKKREKKEIVVIRHTMIIL